MHTTQSHTKVVLESTKIPSSQENRESVKLVDKKNFDYLGIFASSLCLIHCLFLPILLTYFTEFFHSVFVQFNLETAEEVFHIAILPIIIYLALVSLSAGYKTHKHASAITLGIIGIALLSGSMLTHDIFDEGIITKTNIIGSISLISAHALNIIYNYRYSLQSTKSSTCKHISCSCKK